MPLVFSSSPEMTIGVELELQLINRETLDLTPAASQIFERLGGTDERIKPEIFQSMLEINTGVCATVAQARADLQASLTRLRSACDPQGIELALAGSHPFARYTDRVLYPAERYQYLIDRNQWLARRLIIFGLHVHVGMRDGDHAMAMMNGVLPYLSWLLALSASSPFWNGVDTGLASSRATIFESVPTAGTPTLFSDWKAFEAFHDIMLRSRSIGSLKDLWWDIRPNAEFGTLEVRICDVLPTLSETMALVALLRCLYGWLDEEHLGGRPLPPPPAWLLRENKWRAARHGLEADILLDESGRLSPLREAFRDLLVRLEPQAEALGCRAELAAVGHMLESDGSHVRQRRVFERTHSLPAVVEDVIREGRDEGAA